MPLGDLATYTITTGRDSTHKILADSWKKDEVTGTTKFYKSGKVVAEFQWFDSIVRDGDDDTQES